MMAIGRPHSIQRPSIAKLNFLYYIGVENTLTTFYEHVFILVMTSGHKVLGIGGEQAFQLLHTFSRLTSGSSGIIALSSQLIWSQTFLYLGQIIFSLPQQFWPLANSHVLVPDLSSAYDLLTKQARPRRPPLVSLVQSDVPYTRLTVYTALQ